ncbi:MAG: endonuclease/exonuclease/phosphatase family protein [Cellulomonas sp.]|uniref:endonuclease/exonuclease/phosphatase family protein n=1 Tax=Cellulomonas sp. TaxID=40001 RepID=UPI0019EB2994|nr:endonuclease/exonuclease/phosphatase family protein [Cellulomonas sp.]MBF0687503.1 endonuclease/exonuclease/phosphatase family protein [Cellulomonas sp.]
MEPGSRATLRVLTFNVLAPANPDWARRADLVVRTVRGLAPDVAAFQEVPVGDDGAFLRALMGDDVHVAVHRSPDEHGVGAALVSRWPLRDVEHVDQVVTRRPGLLPWLGSVVADVDTPLGTVTVAHHKPTWELDREGERVRQAVRLVDALARRPPTVARVVLGDLDATPDATSLRFLRGREPVEGRSTFHQDCWETVHGDVPGHTFAPTNPLVADGQMATVLPRRIDHVLVGGGAFGPALDVVDCRRVLDRPVAGAWASDHAGVLADLALPTHAPGAWHAPADDPSRRA